MEQTERIEITASQRGAGHVVGPKISVRNLVAHYGEQLVLDDISLDVMSGETMVILGGSGCGKSTLLRCLIGLHKPTEGEILIDGADITKLSPPELDEIRLRFGVLFQSSALFNSMTVGDNVALALREHTELEESVIDIMVKMKLEMVGLTGSEKLMPAHLSGGMRKRAGLARAMAMDPETLFFDEPSAGLDPRASADIDSLILKLKSAFSITMVVVTHELKSAFAIADRITMLDEGKALLSGAPEQVRASGSEAVRLVPRRRAPCRRRAEHRLSGRHHRLKESDWMVYRADEVKVGLVVVAGFLILAGFVVSILGLSLGRPTDTYITKLKFAGGIERGTVVRFGGMQVGKVTDVDVSPLDDTRIRLMMNVKKGLSVKADSEVFINTIGFLGDYYLEISTGSPGSPNLSPGGEINSVEVASINEMLASAQSAIEKVDAAMVILNEKVLTEDFGKFRDRVEIITDKIIQLLTDVDLVFSEENRANIAETLAQLKELVGENKADVRATMESFRSASEKLGSLAATLDEVAEENREDIGLLIDEIQATVAEARSASERIDRLIADNASDIGLTIDNLRATTANTRDFSETIADEPWRLIWRARRAEKMLFEQKEAEPVER